MYLPEEDEQGRASITAKCGASTPCILMSFQWQAVPKRCDELRAHAGCWIQMQKQSCPVTAQIVAGRSSASCHWLPSGHVTPARDGVQLS